MLFFKFKMQNALENLLKVGVKQLKLQMGHRPNNKIYKTEEKKLIFVKKDSAIEVTLVQLFTSL